MWYVLKLFCQVSVAICHGNLTKHVGIYSPAMDWHRVQGGVTVVVNVLVSHATKTEVRSTKMGHFTHKLTLPSSYEKNGQTCPKIQ